MRTGFTTRIAALVAVTTIPVTAFAANCEHEISAEQQSFLDQQNLQIKKPEGELMVVQRCDTNADNVVDIEDIRNISLARNQPARHPDDPMDWDGNNLINVLDARGCVQACTLPRCAPALPQPEPVGGRTEETKCSISQDLDGDGAEDFVGIFENTGEELAGGYNLKLVLVNRDEGGNLQQTTINYAGKMVEEDGKLKVKMHLSEQPAGPVDLSPGGVMLSRPGIVAYSNGVPRVLYYWVNGKLRRAAYLVDD